MTYFKLNRVSWEFSMGRCLRYRDGIHHPTATRFPIMWPDFEAPSWNLYATINLERVPDVSLMCIAFSNENRNLEYVGWTQDSEFPKTAIAAPVVIIQIRSILLR